MKIKNIWNHHLVHLGPRRQIFSLRINRHSTTPEAQAQLFISCFKDPKLLLGHLSGSMGPAPLKKHGEIFCGKVRHTKKNPQIFRDLPVGCGCIPYHANVIYICRTWHIYVYIYVFKKTDMYGKLNVQSSMLSQCWPSNQTFTGHRLPNSWWIFWNQQKYYTGIGGFNPFEKILVNIGNVSPKVKTRTLEQKTPTELYVDFFDTPRSVKPLWNTLSMDFA